MMVNSGSAAVQLTCIQCYGAAAGGEGNFSIWAPEWDAPVGTPVGEPSNATGAWIRTYTQGLALVNADASNRTVALPPGSWRDLYGVDVSSPLEMAPASGAVLVSA